MGSVTTEIKSRPQTVNEAKALKERLSAMAKNLPQPKDVQKDYLTVPSKHFHRRSNTDNVLSGRSGRHRQTQPITRGSSSPEMTDRKRVSRPPQLMITKSPNFEDVRRVRQDSRGRDSQSNRSSVSSYAGTSDTTSPTTPENVQWFTDTPPGSPSSGHFYDSSYSSCSVSPTVRSRSGSHDKRYSRQISKEYFSRGRSDSNSSNLSTSSSSLQRPLGVGPSMSSSSELQKEQWKKWEFLANEQSSDNCEQETLV